MTAPHAIIWGTGLIGASLGMALRDVGWRVGGWDPSLEALDIAAERGAVDHLLSRPTPGDADLLVLAGPPAATVGALRDLETETLVTDVAAVKAPIAAAAGHLPHFVGGHPMSGRAGSGARLATPNLFRGAAWILTSDGTHAADLERMASIVETVGATPITMTAEDHDRAVAVISHLPHVLAAALVETAATDPTALELVAGSFRDLTRVAASDADVWAEILAANAPEVASAISALERRLADWRTALDDPQVEGLTNSLRSSREARSRMAPDVSRVAVPLMDEPGELARVGRALEASAADIRDIQLRHAEHGGGGLLTLTVHARDEEALRLGLSGEGFTPDP